MAFESGSQGSGLLGRVFSAIGSSKKPDIRHIALSPEGDVGYSNLFKDYNSLLGNQTAGLSDFTKQYQALTPQLAGLDQLHASTYGDLLKQAQNYNPTANLRTSGDYLFGNLDKYLNTGLQAGNAALKANLAASGYGDRGPGGYSALLNANRITGNLLPAFNNIVSNLTPLTMSQNSDYFRNIAQVPGLVQAQTDALQATPYRALVPSQIQNQQLQGNLANLNNLTQGQLANWAFYNKPNAWTTAGNVASGIYGGLFDAMDVANKAASTYGNVMTSGLGGQMGLGGGMGGAEAPTSYPQSTGLGSVQPQGYGTGEGYPLPSGSGLVPSSSLYNPPYAQPASVYSPLGVGQGYAPGYTAQYAPYYGQNPYMPYSQNPYGQYGGFFQ